jgi:hypothetical protein
MKKENINDCSVGSIGMTCWGLMVNRLVMSLEWLLQVGGIEIGSRHCYL